MDSFYSHEELRQIGFKNFGNNAKISKKASFYNVSNISIGNNVRIDDFCILSGTIELHSNIHISAYVALYGASGIILEDYSGLSSRTTIYSEVDDFSGNYLIGPMVQNKFRKLTSGIVHIKKYSQIGANAIVFPNVVIEEGVSVGAFSLVNKSLDAWSIYVGIPAKKIKDRSKNLLNFLNEIN